MNTKPHIAAMRHALLLMQQIAEQAYKQYLYLQKRK